MKINRKSKLTGIFHTREINVTKEQIVRWKSGELIQDVMPHLSIGEREFLITGITEEEWLKTFGEEEDELYQNLWKVYDYSPR